ncbi:MAG: hypothetical protein PHP98_11320 [Kiritimatiellae bacterium]|nr:hypothetical protein [Kiritimatiellia bacterium]
MNELMEVLKSIDIVKKTDGIWLHIEGHSKSVCLNISEHAWMAGDVMREWSDNKFKAIAKANNDGNSAASIMKTGIELIAEERKRQVEEEGWKAEHDAAHIGGELARAAACYALPQVMSLQSELISVVVDRGVFWPWSIKCFKPTKDDRVRELQKAGALIAAEIDRRLASKNQVDPVNPIKK